MAQSVLESPTPERVDWVKNFEKHMPEVNSMSMIGCLHIFYLGIVHEYTKNCLADDHIWKCQNLNSHIS